MESLALMFYSRQIAVPMYKNFSYACLETKSMVGREACFSTFLESKAFSVVGGLPNFMLS